MCLEHIRERYEKPQRNKCSYLSTFTYLRSLYLAKISLNCQQECQFVRSEIRNLITQMSKCYRPYREMAKSLACVRASACSFPRIAKDQNAVYLNCCTKQWLQKSNRYIQEHCSACRFMTWGSEHQIPSTLQKHKGKREIKGRKKSKFLNSLMALLLLNIMIKNAS